MKYIRSVLFLILFLSVEYSIAQENLSTKDKKAIEFFKDAMRQYRSHNNEGAATNYLNAINRDTNFTEAHLELGLLYGEKREYKKGIKSLQKVIELDENEYPETYYYLGLFHLNLGEYEKTKLSLNKYLSFENQSLQKKDNSKRMLEQCDFGIKNKNQSVEFNPINMGPEINSWHSEYYPCLTADGETLLYTRNLPTNQTILGINEDFFISKKFGDNWLESKNLGRPINTLHGEGAATISVDGLLIIFTSCELYGDYGPGREGYGSCDLFFSQKIGDRWSNPKNLGKPVNSKHWESQPSFSSDGRTLYFVRGRKERNTSKDNHIFKTYLTDTGWTVPVKLPPPVYAPGHQESVFIHPDGKTLYFASDGHPGFGGLDIFVTRLDEDGNWSIPENLGYPINTQNADNGLMVNAKGDVGYFSSDRKGGFGGMDLYYFEMPEDKRPDKVTFIKGRVIDAITKRPLHAKFELIDLKSGKIKVESYSNGVNGEFLVCLPTGKDYALNASKDGYLFYSENFTLNQMDTADAFLKDVEMMPIRKGSKVVLNNVFFKTNEFELKPESKVELDKLISLLEKNPKISIEIGGHTDNTGSKEANITLSNNRAKSVYNYLIENSVNAERLSFKGYADEEPIANNETIKGKAKNRRTEFKIIAIQP